MKSIVSDLKPIKTGKQPGTTYCFGCKDYSNNFRQEKVKMTNKEKEKFEKSLTVFFVGQISQDF